MVCVWVQGLSRNSYLFSMELALYGQVVLLAMPALLQALGLGEGKGGSAATGGGMGACSGGWWWSLLLSSSDRGQWWECAWSELSGSFRGWTWWTLVPVLSNSLGGIIVGLVTKYAGGVSKGFALIAGILLTAFLQAVATSTPPPPHHWLAALLVVVSTYMHATYPPGPPPTPATAVAQGSSAFTFDQQHASNGSGADKKKKTS